MSVVLTIRSPHANLAFGTLPEWISILVTAGALSAATYAGYWARRAAAETKRQADSAHDQVEVSREQAAAAAQQLLVAREDLERQQAVTDQATKTLREQRLDAFAPVVMGIARPLRDGPPLVTVTETRYAQEATPADLTHQAWAPVPDGGTLIHPPTTDYSGDIVRLVVAIEFTNYSNVPARIAFGGQEMHEIVDWKQGREMYLAPGGSKVVHWMRRISALQVADRLTAPSDTNQYLDLMKLEFLVRDLGMRVWDTYRFNADLRVFSADGSRVTAMPGPFHSWEEDVATPIGDRGYDFTDRSAARTSFSPPIP